MIGSRFIHLIRTDSDAFLFIAELIFHFVYVPQLLLEKGMATHSSILAWRIPMDRGAWWATADGVAKSQTRLSD